MTLAWLAHALGVKGDRDRAVNVLCHLDELAAAIVTSRRITARSRTPASAISTRRSRGSRTRAMNATRR